MDREILKGKGKEEGRKGKGRKRKRRKVADWLKFKFSRTGTCLGEEEKERGREGIATAILLALSIAMQGYRSFIARSIGLLLPPL